MKYFIPVTLFALMKMFWCQTCVQQTSSPDFDDLLVHEHLLWMELGLEGTECASRCFLDPRCHSVQFQRSTGGCTGHATAFANSTKMYPPPTDVPGQRLHLMSRATHYIGSACTSGGDCHLSTSVCNDGICTCPIGYMFSPTQQACVTDCPTLGVGFVRYAGHFTSGYDSNVTHGVEETACQQLCGGDDDCRSFDYKQSESSCHRSSTTYFNVNDTAKVQGSDWAYYQRNCAV